MNKLDKLIAGLVIAAFIISCFLIAWKVFAANPCTPSFHGTTTYPTTLDTYVTGDCIPAAVINNIESFLGTGSGIVQNLFLKVANNLSDVNNSSTALSNLGGMKASNNLSELTNTSTARTNLGAMFGGNNLSELTNTSTARTNIGAMYGANNLSEIVSSSSARNNIGLGNVQNATQLWQGNNLTDLTNTSTARNALGYSSSSNITITSTGTLIFATTSVSQFANDAGYATSGGTSAAGSDGWIQYNKAGTMSATSTLTFTSSTQTFNAATATFTNAPTINAWKTNASSSATYGQVSEYFSATSTTATDNGTSATTTLATLSIPAMGQDDELVVQNFLTANGSIGSATNVYIYVNGTSICTVGGVGVAGPWIQTLIIKNLDNTGSQFWTCSSSGTSNIQTGVSSLTLGSAFTASSSYRNTVGNTITLQNFSAYVIKSK